MVISGTHSLLAWPAASSPGNRGSVSKLLEVRDLETKFFTVDGVVHALNGISYSVDRGECLAIVGESGSGKTVGVLSILRLIQSPPGRIVGGTIRFRAPPARSWMITSSARFAAARSPSSSRIP